LGEELPKGPKGDEPREENRAREGTEADGYRKSRGKGEKPNGKGTPSDFREEKDWAGGIRFRACRVDAKGDLDQEKGRPGRSILVSQKRRVVEAQGMRMEGGVGGKGRKRGKGEGVLEMGAKKE